MKPLFARRDVRLLVLAQAFSLFGDAAMWLAMGLWARALTGSDAAAGMVFFALAAPALVAPLGGVVVDRLRRRPLMIVTDIASAGAVLLLLLVHDREQLWLLYVVAVANGIAVSVFGAAQTALLPQIVPEELLGRVNGILQALRQALRVLSPLVGAGLYAVLGGGAVAIVDSWTFLISAGCLFAMRVREKRPAREKTGLVREMTAGVRHVMETVALRRMVASMAAGFLVIGFAETLVFAVVTRILDEPLAFVGVLSAAQGVGAIAGGLTGAWILARLGDGRLVATGLVFFGVGEGLLIVPSATVAIAAMTLAGIGLSFLGVGFYTGLQRRTPNHLQGRASTASDVALTVPQTLSIGAGALLTLVIDFRLLLGLMTLGLVSSGGYLFVKSAAEVWPPQKLTGEESKESFEIDAALSTGTRPLHAHTSRAVDPSIGDGPHQDSNNGGSTPSDSPRKPLHSASATESER